MTIRSIINGLRINDLMKETLISEYKSLNKARRGKRETFDKREEDCYIFGMITALRYSEQIEEKEYEILYELRKRVKVGTATVRRWEKGIIC